MVGKSVSEKLKEKAAKATEQSIMTDDGFKVLGAREEGEGNLFITFSKEDDGFTVIGKFVGFATGKFGKNIVLQTDEGEKQFSMTAGLKDFENIDVDSMVRVRHMGKIELKGGKSFRKFEIAVKKA